MLENSLKNVYIMTSVSRVLYNLFLDFYLGSYCYWTFTIGKIKWKIGVGTR